MKITKSKLREIIREVMTETEAEGYDDPAYRATIEQFKGKQVSKEKFAQALAMHHDSMKNEEILKESRPIAELQVSFMKTPEYKKALRAWKKLEQSLYGKFIDHVKKTGYDIRGSDEDMTWGRLMNKFVSEY